MPFQKGNTIGKGRPKGSSNLITQKVRDKIFRFVDKNLDDIQKEYDKLGPNEKIKCVGFLIQYVIPKMRDLDHKITYTEQ